jgi:hypothetical protein
LTRFRTIVLCLLALGLWHDALQAQNQPVQAGQGAQNAQDAPRQVRRRDVFVRRFSVGVSILAAFPAPVKDETLDQFYATSPQLEVVSKNSDKSKKYGFGAVAQLAITSKWAVAATPTLRNGIRFDALTVNYIGVDNPNTVQDDREGINYDSQTRARFFDVPVLVRYYNKSRYERGPRVFFEVGPRIRQALKVKTITQITQPDGTKTTDNNPVSFRRMSKGASAGFGLQFIDDFGIRFVPEVRYTRWFSGPFGAVNGRSTRQEIEIVFSLMF